MSDIYAENHQRDAPDYCLDCGAPMGVHNLGCKIWHKDTLAEIERLRAAADAARQAIQYSLDMGGTDPAGVLLQALNKCDAALADFSADDRG